MKQGYFLIIKDEYYKKYDSNEILMNNKGPGHNRPCFFAFPDKREQAILWCVPISSQVEKYEKVVAYKTRNQKGKKKTCITIRFGNVMGHKKAFLIQNMFPIIDAYVDNIYVDKNTNNPVTVSSELEKDIIVSAKKVLKLVYYGNPQLVFADVKEMYNMLVEEIMSDAEYESEK